MKRVRLKQLPEYSPSSKWLDCGDYLVHKDHRCVVVVLEDGGLQMAVVSAFKDEPIPFFDALDGSYGVQGEAVGFFDYLQVFKALPEGYFLGEMYGEQANPFAHVEELSVSEFCAANNFQLEGL